ncbi:hypothetical protein J5Y03_16575 [Bacillus sp. RG28]|uniref:Uncharacterized protein n=1 Tax=Gottfriedia endophytica TaxID=2820819 RepID=A0A940NLQ0_9BACI|nr:hypothetical protein [Gottfriedia endophytica]MBP0726775.1 hypothetical protein [Gottfriedia endophytica]
MLKNRLKKVEKAVSINDQKKMRYFICYKDLKVDLVRVTEGQQLLFVGNLENFLIFKQKYNEEGIFIIHSIPRPPEEWESYYKLDKLP